MTTISNITMYNSSLIDENAKSIPLSPHKADVKYTIQTSKLFERVYIEPIALHKMNEYIRMCSDEISWLGTVSVNGNNVTINDVYIFEQEVSGTTTILDENSMTDFALKLLDNPPDGDQQKAIDIINTMRVWGHSHVNMGVSPSGQDDKTMDELRGNIEPTEMPFMIRLIGNKKGDMKIDIYYYAMGVTALDVPWQPVVQKFELSFADELKEKIKKKTYVATPYQHNSTVHNNSGTVHTWQNQIQKKTEENTGNQRERKPDEPIADFLTRRNTANNAGWASYGDLYDNWGYGH